MYFFSCHGSNQRTIWHGDVELLIEACSADQDVKAVYDLVLSKRIMQNNTPYVSGNQVVKQLLLPQLGGTGREPVHQTARVSTERRGTTLAPLFRAVARRGIIPIV